MTAHFVADIGNTRIKWASWDDRGLGQVNAASQAGELLNQPLPEASSWTIASVVPKTLDSLRRGLEDRGHAVQVVGDFRQFPLEVDVETPEKVGMDRLLNALAISARIREEQGAIIVSLGTAVTVDLLQPRRIYRGGVIFPGFRLMAQSLHDHTALLPLVPPSPDSPLLGRNTEDAIASGIRSAVIGGIDHVIAGYQTEQSDLPIFVTGGDVGQLRHWSRSFHDVGPYLALEGLRLMGKSGR